MKSTALALCFFTAVSAAFGQAESDPQAEAKRADIRRMLELTGAGKMGKQVAEQMLGQFRQMHPEVPEQFWAEVAREIDPTELAELSVPSYDRHLTHEEIKGLIAFYETPVGKKLLEVQPLIMQESMMAGQKWGQQLGQKVANKLAAQGLNQRGPKPAGQK